MYARLIPAALLAGTIASASADPGDRDTLSLTSGEVIVGELIDVRDGKYWVLRDDGRMVSVDFRAVAAVEMGGNNLEPVNPRDLELPSWSDGPADTNTRAVSAGFDFGLTQGLRARFRVGSPAVAHVDTTLGLGIVVAGGIGPDVHTKAEVAFFGNSPVHLTLGASLGGAIIWGSFYPMVGVGAGAQFDPKGPFEVHLGATVGTTFSYFAFSPDLSVAWVW